MRSGLERLWARRIQPLFYLSLLWFAALLAQEPESDAIDLPDGGAAWHHEGTGLSLPQGLGRLTMEGGQVYKDPALGVQVRFSMLPFRVRSDVFVFPCPQSCKTAQDRKTAAIDGMREAMSSLKAMETQGRWRDVQWKNPEMQEIRLGDGNTTFLVTVPSQYTMLYGKDTAAVTSITGVLVFRNHLLKLRCTIPASASRETAEARKDFIQEFVRCVQDASEREAILAKIADYRKDPLSASGRKNARAIVEFAQRSTVVNVVMSDALQYLATRCGTRVKGAEDDVAHAFIVGITEASLKDRKTADIVDAGIAEVFSICHRLEEAHAGFHLPDLKEWEWEAALKKDHQGC